MLLSSHSAASSHSKSATGSIWSMIPSASTSDPDQEQAANGMMHASLQLQ